MAKRVVIALGGNAILRPKQKPTYQNQLVNVKLSAEFIAKIDELDYEIVLTHGNGPQVGNILFQNEEADHVIPKYPLDVCIAEAQGLIGYMMEQSLKNVLAQKGSTSSVATLLTQVEVAENDPAFSRPSKFIGLYYSPEAAAKIRLDKNWLMAEDSGKGYRHLVPCPEPQLIHGIESMVKLVQSNTIVIAGGGGGIPVVKDHGVLTGIEAVVDKDLVGAQLAQQLDADVYMMLTNIDNAYLNYGKSHQERLGKISLTEAKRYFAEHHFASGSMKPKMAAAIRFAELGKEAIICSLEEAESALLGKAGTHVIKG
ncbi:carbamate kinase [uncultured Vagococcus sp.]|uniref:carbamate kinase n=1 Tax=uncultured Vagococcus sp. TaxID=189676 RepID=UPI0028D5BE02|nr:carbamate kinase [uncultured Vagococcus sp.]